MLCLQVVEKLIRGLAMEDSRNMFALFEHNNTVDKAVESRVLVADVLAKFERCVIPVCVAYIDKCKDAFSTAYIHCTIFMTLK